MFELREMDDETLTELCQELGNLRVPAVEHEVSRRAEIKLCRVVEGTITEAELVESHDASWYNSRQTEEQFLAEMGVEA